MKISELRTTEQKKLNDKLKKLKKESFVTRFSKFTGGDDTAPMKAKSIKKDIARLKTVMNENKFKTGV